MAVNEYLLVWIPWEYPHQNLLPMQNTSADERIISDNRITDKNGMFKDERAHTKGETITLPTAADVTRESYTFVGWYDNDDLLGLPVTQICSTDSGNKSYWAKWSDAKEQDPDRSDSGQGGAATTGQTAEVFPCHHEYVWEIARKGTSLTDGLRQYRCKYCGDVKYEVPIAAYYNFNQETQESILQASPNATVTITTPIFVSFHRMICGALMHRPDVTLVVNYRYQGKDYEMTIPAGSDDVIDEFFGEDDYAGFCYLGSIFTTVEK